MASAPAIEIFSHDPEVLALQAMIKGLRHCNGKMTMRHLKVMLAIRLGYKTTGKLVTVKGIESFTGLKKSQFESELRDLVAKRYVHEGHSKYGDLVPLYKLGSLGGTILSYMFKHLPPECADNDA